MNSDGRSTSSSSTCPLPVMTTGNRIRQAPSRQQFREFEARNPHFGGQQFQEFEARNPHFRAQQFQAFEVRNPHFRAQQFQAFEVRHPSFGGQRFPSFVNWTNRGNLGQSQGMGYIQQSNMPPGAVISYNPGLPSGWVNINAQVPSQYIIPCHSHMGACDLHAFIPPSYSNTYTVQQIPYLDQANPSFSPQPSRSSIPPAAPISRPRTPRVRPSPISRPRPSPISRPPPPPPPPHPSPSQPLSPQTDLAVQPHSPQTDHAEETIEPTGYKCNICHRDLSYPPEGSTSDSQVLPVSAVLVCGHTFHDSCFNIMKSDQQSTDPTCMVCALGNLKTV